MKVGDLVQYSAEDVETNIGMVLLESAEGWAWVMWDDGAIFVHNKEEFKVINESR